MAAGSAGDAQKNHQALVSKWDTLQKIRTLAVENSVQLLVKSKVTSALTSTGMALRELPKGLGMAKDTYVIVDLATMKDNNLILN